MSCQSYRIKGSERRQGSVKVKLLILRCDVNDNTLPNKVSSDLMNGCITSWYCTILWLHILDHVRYKDNQHFLSMHSNQRERNSIFPWQERKSKCPVLAHVRPTSVFHHHHKWHRNYFHRDCQDKGAVASNSWGGWGVANFCMLWEAPDQREPTIEGLKVAQIERNFPQNRPSRANFEGQVWQTW